MLDTAAAFLTLALLRKTGGFKIGGKGAGSYEGHLLVSWSESLRVTLGKDCFADLKLLCIQELHEELVRLCLLWAPPPESPISVAPG